MPPFVLEWILKLGGSGLAIAIIGGGAYLWVEDVKDDARQDMQTQITTVQQEYKRALAEAERDIEKRYYEKHIARVEKTADTIVEIQKNASMTITPGSLLERGATAEGRAELKARSAERTRQLMTKMEQLSDWSDVYGEVYIPSTGN